MADIVFSKGALSEGVYADSVSEEYSNKLMILNIPQTAPNQASGAKKTKILDLLRITHQFVIKSVITEESSKTAKQIKNNLKSIANGGGIAGGVVTMTYDGDSYEGYLEKIVITKEADDSANETSEQVRKYTLAITFVVGEPTAG